MIFSSLLSIRSHPVRVRGLKLLCELAKATGGRVAPHVGAWIETSKLGGVRQPLQVAPHAGA